MKWSCQRTLFQDASNFLPTGLQQRLNELLVTHSSIHHVPTRTIPQKPELTPWGTLHERRGILSIGYSSWNPLSPTGLQLQATTLEAVQHFFEIIRVLFLGQPEKALREFSDDKAVIMASIQQDSSPQGSSPHEVAAKVTASLQRILATLRNLYNGSDGRLVLVPDTNALLFNVNLEMWSYDDVSNFTMLLLPTVLRELDALKVNYKNEEVRKKADGLISRIKGYRSRGTLNEGVTLRKNFSELRSWAVEPKMQSSVLSRKSVHKPS